MPDWLGETTTLPHRERSPFLVVDRGHLRASSHCLLLVRGEDEIEIPVAIVSSILIEPGVTVTHEAVKLAAENGTLLVWVGEAGVRVYSAGMPGGKHAERLIQQVKIHLDPVERLAAAKRLYELMFDCDMPDTRSIEKLRGMEGSMVKKQYQEIASLHGVEWTGRANAPIPLQDALGFATSCLYGVAEAVILASGYTPAIGIVHSGDRRSMVYDLADTIKFKTVIRAAFEVFQESGVDTKNRVRRRCRDMFREQKTAEVLFGNLFEIMAEKCGSY